MLGLSYKNLIRPLPNSDDLNPNHKTLNCGSAADQRVKPTR